MWRSNTAGQTINTIGYRHWQPADQGFEFPPREQQTPEALASYQKVEIEKVADHQGRWHQAGVRLIPITSEFGNESDDDFAPGDVR
jgi:hypothetical protein